MGLNFMKSLPSTLESHTKTYVPSLIFYDGGHSASTFYTTDDFQALAFTVMRRPVWYVYLIVLFFVVLLCAGLSFVFVRFRRRSALASATSLQAFCDKTKQGDIE